MTRIDLAAAAVLCSFIHIGCDSGTTNVPFKAKQDGATSTGGSDPGSDGATGTGGSSGGSNTGGASGSSSTGGTSAGDSGSSCGTVFGHPGACETCLEANCCSLGDACSKIANCVSLAECTRDCDATGGTMAQVDQCRSTCAGQFLNDQSRGVYNPLVQCMAQSCLSQCPFHGP
jgi:hypothetical protein